MLQSKAAGVVSDELGVSRTSNAAVGECNSAGGQRDSRALLPCKRRASHFHPSTHVWKVELQQSSTRFTPPGPTSRKASPVLLVFACIPSPCTRWVVDCGMHNVVQGSVSANLVFHQHVLDTLLKHFQPFTFPNSVSPVMVLPSCHRETTESKRPRVPLFRNSFARPTQHSPVKSLVPREPVRALTCQAVVGD